MTRRANFALALEALREEGTVPSLLYSLALHALFVLLLLIAMSHAAPAPLPLPIPTILADLVPLTDITTSPDAAQHSLVPQQRAPEQSNKPDATAVPVPNDRMVTSAHDHAEAKPKKSAQAVRNGEAPEKRAASVGEDHDAGGDLNARLEAFAKMHEPPSRLEPDPRPQEGIGTSNATAADDYSRRGNIAGYGIKDFVRAQIERRWYLDRNDKAAQAAQAQAWTVSLHLYVEPDGSIAKVEVVNNSANADNVTYQDYAQSVRNAALLSSPLQLLPGSYDTVKDIVLDFTPHRTTQ